MRSLEHSPQLFMLARPTPRCARSSMCLVAMTGIFWNINRMGLSEFGPKRIADTYEGVQLHIR